ncbi:uncharacterized protein LOC143856782 [Tasmannia lanceolata]|uniref:uncharacterized protein LOC143856782 n=1 Tax=Tasmannia lanceolata TaxID=3420 RepID=UPI0040635DEC
MQTLNSLSPPSPSSQEKEQQLLQNPNPSSPSLSSQTEESDLLRNPNPSPSSVTPASRLWKPAAQRNLRNQWSKFLSHKDRWISASSNGRSHATSIVNSHLSQRYMPGMNLGVLSEMPDIRRRACQKLARQQELYRSNLLSSYKDTVGVVSDMISTSGSMRCFLKGAAGSPLVQFCSHPGDSKDTGDGGGVPVFSSLSIACFENLAQELAQMFVLELSLKRLLVVELLSISCEETPKGQTNRLSWADELYPGEFGDLSISELYSEETCEPLPPRINGWEFDNSMTGQSKHPPDREVLQVYLTAWLVEANVDTYRVDQIFSIVGEEMHVSLS